MGVSISRNPFCSRYCLARWTSLLLKTMAWTISVLLRSRYLYFMRVSSLGRTPSFWSPSSNGGIAEEFKSSALVIRTSTSPVGLLGSSVPSTLFLTMPSTETTHSRVKVDMTFSIPSLSDPAGRSSGSKTICVMPYLSARSMKATPPWSLENLTHPWRHTCLPMSDGLRSPHVFVLLIRAPVYCARYSGATIKAWPTSEGNPDASHARDVAIWAGHTRTGPS